MPVAATAHAELLQPVVPVFAQDHGGKCSGGEVAECEGRHRRGFQPMCHNGHAHQVLQRLMACLLPVTAIACCSAYPDIPVPMITHLACAVLRANTRRQHPYNWTALKETFEEVGPGALHVPTAPPYFVCVHVLNRSRP